MRAPSTSDSVAAMPTPAVRKAPRRRARGTANTVQLMVHVEPAVKELLDSMASAAGVHQWEVVTAALIQIAETTDPNGVPAALVDADQPTLLDPPRRLTLRTA